MSGRGGAGNIEAASAAPILPQHNTTPATPNPVEAKYQISKEEEKRKQEWAHMGRGGAGNYYSPRTLHAQGTFASQAQAPADKKVTVPDAPVTGAYAGRGGAGNFTGGTGAEEEEEDEDAKLREAIERDLEKDMPREPGRAWLGGREKGEGALSVGVE